MSPQYNDESYKHRLFSYMYVFILCNLILLVRVFGDFKPYPRHTMEKLVPETLSHLTSSYLEYFAKWSKLLLIESSMEAKWKTIRDVWTKPVKDRYKSR